MSDTSALVRGPSSERSSKANKIIKVAGSIYHIPTFWSLHCVYAHSNVSLSYVAKITIISRKQLRKTTQPPMNQSLILLTENLLC